jgi:hypothetical protein
VVISQSSRVARLLKTRTEIIERRTVWVRHKDFRDARFDAVSHDVVQGVDEFVTKADVRPDDEIECVELLGLDVLKRKLEGLDENPVELGVQMEIRKHRRVSVEPRHVGVERFGAIDSHQSPAAAELQHACPCVDAALLEIVHQHETGTPDLLAMKRGRRRFSL